MKKIGLSLIALVFIAFIACKEEKKEPQIEDEKTEEVKKEVKASNSSLENKKIMVRLEPKSESNATGKLFLKEVDGVVYLEANIMGFSPGIHAIHIHETADCSSADGKSSGGHWNPTFKNHGKWGDENVSCSWA